MFGFSHIAETVAIHKDRFIERYVHSSNVVYEIYKAFIIGLPPPTCSVSRDILFYNRSFFLSVFFLSLPPGLHVAVKIQNGCQYIKNEHYLSLF